MARKGQWLLNGAVIAIIAAFSIMPMQWKLALGIAYRVYPISFANTVFFINPHAIAHAFAFGGAALFLMRDAGSNVRKLMIGGALTALAIGTESAQHLIFRNAFEWNDLKLDLLSLALAMVFVTSAFPNRNPGLSFLAERPPKGPASSK